MSTWGRRRIEEGGNDCCAMSPGLRQGKPVLDRGRERQDGKGEDGADQEAAAEAGDHSPMVTAGMLGVDGLRSMTGMGRSVGDAVGFHWTWNRGRVTA